MEKSLTTVLEITQTHIKLVQAKTISSRKIITAIQLKAISETTDESVAKTIKEIISASKIKLENLICVIPRSSTIVRNLRLPSQDPIEIEDMLDLQIKQQIPYSKEDIISDYLIIKKDVKGYSDVLLVTAHKSVIERYVKMLNLAGLDPDIFSLSSLGISNWYGFYQTGIDKSVGEVVLLINIDSSASDLCFCCLGNLIFSRSVSFGLDDLNSEKISGFIEQIHLTLASYRKEKDNPEVSKVILVSQSDKLTDLSQRLKSELSLAVEIINPLDNLPKDKGLLQLMPASIENISLTAMLGLALRGNESQLNLLPEDIYQKQKARSFKKEFMRSLTLFVLVAILVSLSVALNIYKKQRYLKQIKAAIEEIDPSVKMAERAAKKLTLIKQRLSRTTTSIDIIYELYNTLPAQMSLNVFSLDENDNVTVQGVSNQMSDVFSFQSSLEKSKYFKNVEVKYASKRRTKDAEITDFSITCQVNRK